MAGANRRLTDAVEWDDYNSNLDFVIEDDGVTAATVNKEGFAYMWSGSRAKIGVTRGRYYFECYVVDNPAVDMPDTTPRNQNIMRVGWSEGNTELVLGETEGSFGFGGTGKVSSNREFITYGKPFSVGDVVGCYIDLDSSPGTVSFSVNGKFYGKAFGIPSRYEGRAFFPHVFLKNVKITAFFGEGRAPRWSQRDDFGYSFIGDAPKEDRALPPHLPMRSHADCEVVMLVGLPATGKTTWAKKYAKESGEKYEILGTDLILDQMRVNHLRRQRNFHERFERLMQMSSGVFNELLKLGGQKVRNYILDQTNVYPRARSRKLSNFANFGTKKAVVFIPTMEDYEWYKAQKLKKENKEVPPEAVANFKINFTLPEKPEFDEIEYAFNDDKTCRRILRQIQGEGNDFKRRNPHLFDNRGRPFPGGAGGGAPSGGRDRSPRRWGGSGGGRGGGDRAPW